MPPAIPRATYRLQLGRDFGFDRAAALVPYLRDLGISHLYASPFLAARPGSTHAYDIVDHNRLNPEFGGEEAFARLSTALSAADIGLILDFVPNHMGVGPDNIWWLDVLEWGQASPFAAMFDIDWATLPFRPGGGVLLPILGKPYGETLENGEITLQYDRAASRFSFHYFEHRLPVRPNRYSEIIKTAVAFGDAGATAAGRALLAVAAKYASPRLPTRAQAPALKPALAAIADAPAIIDAGLAAYRPSDPAGVVALHRLLERQHYRLAHWRVAISEINYRRFFDINELCGIRVEEPETFRFVHRRVARLIADGQIHGLRLDHIDGLYDPAQYCRRLQRLIADNRPADATQPFYVVVEKILGDGEDLPPLAGVAGTTGYDALNLIQRALLDEVGLPVLEQAWQTHGAPSRNYPQIVEEAKLRIIDATMSSEFTVLTRLLSRIAAGHWPSRDFTHDRLRAAFQLFVTHFPVYRTYSAGACRAQDRAIIAQAISAARGHWYGSDEAIFDFLQDALTLDLIAPGRAGYSSARVRRFAAKVQQFTGPVTAKAVEDTAFYRYHRLLALNEVGNDPSLSALPAEAFHQKMSQRARQYPNAMTATATHDTKRGEDARARILALAELAQDWASAVPLWVELNAKLIARGKHRSPSRAHEYMIYQALIGVWPIVGTDPALVSRLQAYAIKAAREGKQETSWTNPNDTYESELRDFIARLLDPVKSAEFLADFSTLARRAALLGALNSLSQLVLKATIPGVPDFYQGTELWDLSLVDPDNRRAVDFEDRASALTTVGIARWPDLAADWLDGRIKLALTARLLAIRAKWPGVLTDGDYRPIAAHGPQTGHILAFARTVREDAIIVAVGRHFAPLTDGGRHWPRGQDWQAGLDFGRYRIIENLLTDTKPTDDIALAALFDPLPVAVLWAQRRR